MPGSKNVLVPCTGNPCRSQPLHGYLQQLLGNQATVYNTGVEVYGVNPKAIQAMREDGVDTSQHTSNHVDEYAAVPCDYVLTVCDHAKEVCPVFPHRRKSCITTCPTQPRLRAVRKKLCSSFAPCATK